MNKQESNKTKADKDLERRELYVLKHLGRTKGVDMIKAFNAMRNSR